MKNAIFNIKFRIKFLMDIALGVGFNNQIKQNL
jgi:hypothetical protein